MEGPSKEEQDILVSATSLTDDQYAMLSVIWRIEETQNLRVSQFPEDLTPSNIEEAFRHHIRPIKIGRVWAILRQLVQKGFLITGEGPEGRKAYRSSKVVREYKELMLTMIMEPIINAFGGGHLWHFLKLMRKAYPYHATSFGETQPITVPDNKWDEEKEEEPEMGNQEDDFVY